MILRHMICLSVLFLLVGVFGVGLTSLDSHGAAPTNDSMGKFA